MSEYTHHSQTYIKPLPLVPDMPGASPGINYLVTPKSILVETSKQDSLEKDADLLMTVSMNSRVTQPMLSLCSSHRAD